VKTEKNALLLRFELPPGAPLPPTSYRWAEAPPLPLTGNTPQLREDAVPVRVYSGVGRGDIVQAFLFRYEDPEQAVALIRFPAQLKLSALCTFIANVLNVTYDENRETLTLYKESGSTGRMGHIKVGDYAQRGVEYDFLRKPTPHRIWAHKEEKLPVAMVPIEVIYSDDGYIVQGTSHAVQIQKEGTVADLRRAMIRAGFAPDVPDLRFFRFYSGVVANGRLLGLGDKIDDMHAVRVDRVPPEQIGVPQAKLLQVSSANLQFNMGAPTLMLFDENETAAEFVARAKKLLRLEATEVFFSVARENGRAQGERRVDGEIKFGEFLKGVGLERKVFVVFGTPRAQRQNPTTTERSIKIYN
jgi:hypothetical protein